MKNEGGFSLAELLVDTGLLAVISLGVMQLMKNQNEVLQTAETKSEELELYNQVRIAMIKKENCQATLNGVALGSEFDEIVDGGSGNILFQVGRKYGTNTIELEKLELIEKDIPAGGGLGTAILKLSIKRLKKKQGANQISRDILLQVKASSANLVEECFSDESNTILTAKIESCESLNGIFDPVNEKCNLNCDPDVSDSSAVSSSCLENKEINVYDEKYVNTSGDTMTGSLTVQDTMTSTNTISGNKLESSTNVCVGSNCRDFSKQSCRPGMFVKTIKGDGTLDCASISCPPNKYFEGFDSDGNQICKSLPTETCPVGEYVKEISQDGTVVCDKVPVITSLECPNGTFMTGIMNGQPICENACSGTNERIRYSKSTVVHPDTCLSQQQTRTCSDGSWSNWSGTYNATSCNVCYPSCPSPSTICKGTVDTRANGCGGSCNVSGTKSCITYYDCRISNYYDRNVCSHSRWSPNNTSCGSSKTTSSLCYGPPGSSPMSSEDIYAARCSCRKL